LKCPKNITVTLSGAGNLIVDYEQESELKQHIFSNIGAGETVNYTPLRNRWGRRSCRQVKHKTSLSADLIIQHREESRLRKCKEGSTTLEGPSFTMSLIGLIGENQLLFGIEDTIQDRFRCIYNRL
jgi:hypothetical protein